MNFFFKKQRNIVEEFFNKFLKLNNFEGVLKCEALFKKNDSLYIIREYKKHNLVDAFKFSPNFLNGYLPKLFIIYQIVQTIHSLHSIGLSFGDVRLHDVSCDSRFWIKIRQPKPNSVYKEISPRKIQEDNEDKSLKLLKYVSQWQNGELSNLEYLLILNKLAGRRNSDPNYHPIVPWVTNFKKKGHIRDLTTSKYRLNKGDTQLDITYGQALERGDHNAHHVSEVLSDITYYMYKARNTQKNILCKHVREKWVPGEYPATMARLYSWTPDECIPEFYMDSKILISIHDDLPDLILPDWCKSPQDFIRWHRQILEQDEVSLQLHNWIDITFGYKLTGEDAVFEKNVCLQFVDQHIDLRNYGVMQLFQKPHPQKLPRLNQTIPLQPDWKNLELLRSLEKKSKFSESFISGNDSFKNSKNYLNETNYISSLLSRDLQCLTCLIIEIYCPNQIVHSSFFSFKERFEIARKLCKESLHTFPRFY